MRVSNLGADDKRVRVVERVPISEVEKVVVTDVHDELNSTQRSRIAGMCTIRDHARALLDAQLVQEDDAWLVVTAAALQRQPLQ